MSTEAAIEVILRSSDGQDGFHERRFTLGPNTKMPIGRASKNTAKPELMMAQSNAFVDSPVISREHAILSLDHTSPTPSVCIIDNGSMHGTTVNGDRLEPNRPLKLSNGDLLQFGQDVTRNESFYVARKYVFDSSLPNDYPRGFSVPDGETSEEEDIDVDEVDDLMSAQVPRYGSQINPVNLDDFEDAPPAAIPEVIEIDDDEEEDQGAEDETVVPAEPAPASEGTEERILSSPIVERIPSPIEERIPSSPVEERVYPEEAFNDHDELAPTRYAFVGEASSDEGDGQSVYSSDGEDSLHGSSMSQANNESDSDAEPASDLEASDGNDEENVENENEDEDEDVDAVRRMKMVAMLNHEHEHTALPESPVTPRPSAPIAVPHLINSPTAPSPRRDELHNFFSTNGQPAPHSSLRAPEPAMPAMDPYMNPLGMFEDAFGSHVFGHMDSPLPPRPAAPKPGPWGASPYSNPFTPRESHNLRMFSEDLPSTSMFLSSNTEFSSDLFDRYSGPAGSDAFHTKFPSHQPQVLSENPWTPPKPSTTNEVLTSTATAANSVQTPPPAPASEMSSPPQPRRTKVSIPEIVDSPQRPPTPTSVAGSLKRKADVFEEDVLDAASEPSSLPAAEPQAFPVTAPMAEVTDAPATPASERPIKRLRSRLGSAAKNLATYILPGAALTVALITQLPEAFYEK